MAVMNQRNGSADTEQFIEKLHDIRKEAYEAKMKRLNGKEHVSATAKTGGKQIGYSFKSGQDAAFASKYAYSFIGGDKITPGKMKKK